MTPQSPGGPTFLSLPVELRELIYAHLFSSYTIRHGFHQHAPATPANRTAVLLTCRQMHAEAWRHLPLNSTLVFRGTENMLETLLGVEQAVVTRLRYVHVRTAYPFPLYASGRGYYPTYHAGRALEMVPGLCLDELVVEDCWHGNGMGDVLLPSPPPSPSLSPPFPKLTPPLQGWRDTTTYFDIETLLTSSAWRVLIYKTPCTDFLASGYDARAKRLPQPETWDAMLKARDSPSPSPSCPPSPSPSAASVEMFITPTPPRSSPTSTTVPLLLPWSASPGNLVFSDASLATPHQGLKGAVTIVARRGRWARPAQTGLREARSWREVKGAAGEFVRADWTPYHNDMADAMGWVYGGWGRRMQLANEALGGCAGGEG